MWQRKVLLVLPCKLTLPPSSMVASMVCNLPKNMREPSFLSHVLMIHVLNDPLPVAILQDKCTAELRVCLISGLMFSPEVALQSSN